MGMLALSQQFTQRGGDLIEKKAASDTEYIQAAGRREKEAD